MMKSIKMIILIIVLVLPFSLHAKQTISILYFDNTSGNEEYDWLRKGIADMLITDVAKSRYVRVVERGQLESILKEQALTFSGAIDEESAVEVGKLLNANTLIYGSFIIADKAIRIDARITDVETAIIATSLQSSGKVTEVFSVEKELAQKIFEYFEYAPPPELEVKETESYEAAKTYYEGISFLDNDEMEKAAERFRKAGDLDPLYRKPQKSLEEAYQFLKDFKQLRKQREMATLYEKADKLRIRLESDEWKTYAELVMETDFASMSPEEQQQFNDDHQAYVLCNTPTQCTWHLLFTLQEIGMKYESDFGNMEAKEKLYEEMLSIAQKSRETFAGDPFLPEILYMEIFTLNQLKKHDQVKSKAEEFMMEYPDYRLIGFVEDIYEQTLNNLDNEQKN